MVVAAAKYFFGIMGASQELFENNFAHLFEVPNKNSEIS